MRKHHSIKALSLALVCALLPLCEPPSDASAGARAGRHTALPVQDFIPSPPADRALVYTKSEKGTLEPLPFEAGTSPLSMDSVAGSNKVSRVELKGERAPLSLGESLPHFYLFVPDVQSPKPPLLVRLTHRGGGRRVTVVAERGLRGFAVASEEIVKPRYRVLGREGGMIFLEIWPREPLAAGEYAFVGSDLQRIAVFGVR